jgi:hypothetical protein
MVGGAPTLLVIVSSMFLALMPITTSPGLEKKQIVLAQLPPPQSEKLRMPAWNVTV